MYIYKIVFIESVCIESKPYRTLYRRTGCLVLNNAYLIPFNENTCLCGLTF